MRKPTTFALSHALVAAAVVSAVLTAPAAAQPGLGIASFTTTASSEQAGAHADVSSSFSLATDSLGNPIGELKNVNVVLPAGVIGDPQAIERCSMRSFMTGRCSPDSQVGLFQVSLITCRGLETQLTAPVEAGATSITVASTEGLCAEEQNGQDLITIGSGGSAETAKIGYLLTSTTIELASPLEHPHASGEPISHIARPVEGPLPLYNLAALPGHIATFGVFFLGVPILVDAGLDSQGRLTAKIEDTSTLLPLAGGGLTLWGVPADPSHDSLRCVELLYSCGPSSAPPAAFLTNPTDCTGPPPETELTIESWQGATATRSAAEPRPTGCDLLTIEPSLQVAPDTSQLDSPAGYTVDLTVRQRAEPYGLATPAIDDLSLALPAGTSLSPAFANGLQACSDSQFGENRCPDASKMGTAEIDTPLLPSPLSGAVYFGQPTSTEKYRMLVRVSGDNTTIGFAGRAEPNVHTGQVTAVFEHAPPLPFKELRLSLFGGPTAALDNPVSCGSATSVATITAYGGAQATPSSSFTATGTCPAAQPFTPQFSAGVTSPIAAAFSTFTLTVSRADGEQDLGGFTAALPQGLIGLLRGVTACPEPGAARGECAAASQVGNATVGAGAGPAPLYLSGPVYLTGPYDGAPFGLAVAINASAGPIDLGEVVVRARVNVDPDGSGLTITTDSLPQMVAGVPLRIRALNVTLNRPEFMLDPTSCATQTVSATVASTTGATAQVSTPFNLTGCRDGLQFSPHLTASTRAGATLAGQGADLEIHLTPGAIGSATTKTVSVTMPGLLRPRLTTIQHACLISAASPANCASEAQVGSATVTTPALQQPLTGPLELITRGGDSTPQLAIMLTGGGINVQLDGVVNISSTGAVTATFDELPDIPVDALNLSLPSGPHSLLGAVANVCTRSMHLTYTLGDRSGDTDRGTTPIAVTGCPRKRTSTRKARARGRRRAAHVGTHAKPDRLNSDHRGQRT